MSARNDAIDAAAKATTALRAASLAATGWPASQREVALTAVDAAIPVLLAPIREVHRERTLQAIYGEDCVREQCDHEDECPTTGVAVCAQCFDIASAVNYYHAEERIVDEVRWPCATARLLDQIEGGESR